MVPNGKVTTKPTASLIVRDTTTGPFYEAKFHVNGTQIKRRVGRAWLDADHRPRKGRVPEDYFDERRATVRAAELVAGYLADDQADRERKAAGVKIRELGQEYLAWIADVKKSKPSTLADYRYMLGEPDREHGQGKSSGWIMREIGDKPAVAVTTRDIEAVLGKVAKSGASPRTVNKYRGLLGAMFRYGMSSEVHGLPANPARETIKRKQDAPGPLDYYSPAEIETLAAACRGQDAELVRVAAYTGLRLGELLALRWRDIDFKGHVITVSRAMSDGVELTPKSGKARRVPLAKQAAAALERLRQRRHFTGSNDLVFGNELGRPQDGSTLRHKYIRARERSGLRPLRFHDLRHCFGSRLAANGIDLVSIKDAMGHQDLATTTRYLHARPATELAEAFSAAFEA